MQMVNYGNAHAKTCVRSLHIRHPAKKIHYVSIQLHATAGSAISLQQTKKAQWRKQYGTLVFFFFFF